MANKKNIFKIASVYTALILGAGFLSGQELSIFFVQYGNKGLAGLVLSGFLFVFVAGATLSICYQNNLKSYTEFINYVVGKKLSFCLEIVVVLFLFIIFSTMLSAGGYAISQAFYINKNIGTIVIALLCFFIFLYDLNGIVEVNLILAPIMVFGSIFMALYTYFNLNTEVFFQNGVEYKNNWFFSAIIYASYNTLTAVCVLSTMGHLVSSKKDAFYGAFLGGIVMTILGVCLFLPMKLYYEQIQFSELPIYNIMEAYGNTLEYFYLIILLFAIFTTAVGNGFAFIEWCQKNTNINKLLIKIIVVLSAIFASTVDFSNLIKNVYPIFGYVGFVQIILISFIFIKQVDYKKNK